MKLLRTLALSVLVLVPVNSFGANAWFSFVARVLTGGGAIYAAQEIEQSEKFEEITSQTNVSVKEWKSVLEIMAGSALLGLLCKENMKDSLNKCIVRAPVIAGITMLVTSKRFNKIVSKIPYIGAPLGGCNNEECLGCCNECKVRKAIIGIAFYVSMSDYLARAEKFTGLVSSTVKS